MTEFIYKYIPDIIFKNFTNSEGKVFIFSREQQTWVSSLDYIPENFNYIFKYNSKIISIFKKIGLNSEKPVIKISETLSLNDQINLMVYLSFMQIIIEENLDLKKIEIDRDIFNLKIKYFYKYKWIVINNKTNLNFILTDRLIIENQQKNIIIHPLGKRQLLIGLKEEKDIEKLYNYNSKKEGRDFVYHINRLQCITYKNYIFSDSNNETLKNFIIKFSYSKKSISSLINYEESIFIKLLKLFKHPEKDIPYKAEDKEKLIEEILERKKEKNK